ncbi:MAG: DNA polymerase III subunit delta [Clostridia bacterium]|nr:DNA polymerase III subunit delta [Clostridia bacterium]
MTEAEFKAELKSLNGGYLFFGGEDYLKYSYSKMVQKTILDGTFDEFNHIIIYKEDFTPSALSQAISAYPMMAEKKLVEVRGVELNSLKKDILEATIDVLSTLSENEHTVLIFRADTGTFNPGRLPKDPSALYKALTQYLKPVEFEFPTPARLKSWIVRHFSESGVTFDGALCDGLVEICGHDMWTLSNEIDKLSAYVKSQGRETVLKDDIDSITCKTVEYGEFQLTNALLEKNKKLVFETLYRQKSSHEPPYTILASIVRMYSDLLLVQKLYEKGLNKGQIAAQLRMHEFKVGMYLRCISGENPKKFTRALELCSEADVKSKSQSNASSYVALERLISSLCALFCR